MSRKSLSDLVAGDKLAVCSGGVGSRWEIRAVVRVTPTMVVDDKGDKWSCRTGRLRGQSLSSYYISHCMPWEPYHDDIISNQHKEETHRLRSQKLRDFKWIYAEQELVNAAYKLIEPHMAKGE